MSEVAYFYSRDSLAHDPPPVQVDVGGRKLALGGRFVSNPLLTEQTHDVLVAAGLVAQMEPVDPEPAEEDLLYEVHDVDYLEMLHEACMETRTDLGLWVSPATWRAATLMAGAAGRAAELVLGGDFQRALINTRPGGHHATRNEAMGSCYLNELACAAAAARRAGAERVMIVDWDVHTGNGTEKIFWDRADVMALSIHQESWYPENSGRAEMVGGPGAEGRTVNVPLPAATNDAGYQAALTRVVAPLAREFAPDLIILGAGQDPSFYDPQGRMLVSMDGFREMTRMVRELSDEVCAGRLVCALQGGYAPVYGPLCALRVVEGVLAIETDVADPYHGETEWLVTQRPAAEDALDAIDAVLRAQAPHWPSLTQAR
ncbi:MAG TPA: hypothetical protein VMT37_12985 [Solirubrobacterales bacterium]|nr:hypothetical protein [Solirubrobacterales bacterium]